MNPTMRFSDLQAGDRLLVAGYIAGAVSTLLITLGSILKLTGSLPEAPIAFGGGINPTGAQPQPRPSGRGYFDIN